MHPRFSNLVFATAALIALGAAPAAGGPEGGTVVGGAATIQGQGGPAVTVNQSSNSAIINWNTFNIGVKESVRFNQPGSSSVALNRVTGGLGPSEILGTLTANGRVFIINRDGILFGPSAVVNTAGFLASTHDIRNSDFMAGRYNFNIPGRPDASIVNQGRITASSGGFAALVAPGVRNSGTITATLGTVALASGNSFTLDMYGDKLITLAVNDSIASKVIDVATGRPLKSLVANEGKIRANGGRVELTAAAARVVVDSVINTSGVIKANSIGHRNGMIVLGAATGASKPAGAPAQTIKISGTLSAAGKKKGTEGGTILVSGEHIKLASARVDASGRAGGGKVLIGGDWGGGKPNTSLVSNRSAKLETFAIPTATTVSVDAGTTINASATGRGNGGKVVLWSDSETTFAGTILARGGARSGDGGFVEVSSHRLLNYSGTTDTRAPKGSVGTLLLDPENYYINANGLPPKSDPTASAISANALVNQLALNNVVLSTLPSGTNAGDIFVDAKISWSTGNSLTLSAYHDILFMSGTKVTSTGAGNLVLRADNTGTGQGTVVFDSGGHVDYTQSTGTVSLFYNPSGSPTTKYQNPTNYFCPPCPGGGGVFVQQPSQLTAYMLVNTASDLDAVRTNQSGTYALGTKISFDSKQPFTPIPNFTGLFDGQGQTIANLTIASTTQNIGLFGTIASAGEVRNLNLTNVSVNSSVNSQFVGTLAGTNAGTISNVSATGIVQADSGSTAGGLVGQNLGSISNSFASVDVGSPNVANLQAGGLVGNNAGTISSSFATGQVQGGTGSTAGGLVALNLGTITGASAPALTQPCVAGQTCATGAVNVGSNGIGGGLVGSNSGTITNAFATGDVTGAAGTSGFTTLGGLAAVNSSSISNSFASGDVGSPNVANLQAGGLVGNNSATILSSAALGNVQAGDASIAGGLVASNSISGAITGSQASGNVTVAAASVAGGLVGTSAGAITDSTASGAVSSTGSNSTIGGLVGASTGTITASAASGAVSSAGANSTVGGLVGANAGTITDSTASGAVTSSGANSTVGALVGTSTGTITNSTGSGVVTSTGGSSTGGGGTGGTTGGTTSNPPAFPSIIAGCSDPLCGVLNTGILPPATATLPAAAFFESLPGPVQVINNLVGQGPSQLAALNAAAPPVFNTVEGGIRLPQQPAPGSTGSQQGQQQQPAAFGGRVIDIPPPTETRFVKDEVVLQIAGNVTVERLQAAVGRLGLTLLASENLAITGSTVARFRITNGRSPAEIIRALTAIQLVAVAQPNYVYTLQQQPSDPVPASRGDATQGDSAQYMLEKLQISDIHRLVRGANVPIAVIDSEIDVSHPDLEGAVTKRFDAVGAPEEPHAHGTGMAGAIAAHRRLLGTAPAARLLAVHAFSSTAATAESTTFNILKGINWSVQEGVRIINMSFAGPRDPSLERALKAAYDKGIVLIAAAGNAGPKSPPLFPGAIPFVIAVTATDVDDKLFTGANRGKYISVAAPGVDILVPAPEGQYQMTTGTSVAAAEVSGIVALLLERNPKLTPADIRRILTTSAKRLGPGQRDDNFGSGLIDPLQALQLADPRTATRTPPRRR
jgi:filamentous hemagglutinin family protein